jgi:hypothetical protein
MARNAPGESGATPESTGREEEMKHVVSVLLMGILGLGGFAGYQLVRSDVEAAVYRSRLEEAARDYEALRDSYNEAIRRTAVTELRVEQGVLSVAIRNAVGDVRIIETPYDPSREIYVDYAILDGRLWIRRVFDAATPPEKGLLIDPELADVDWEADPDGYGKAAYRSLAEGRWVITATGDGSLGLGRRRSGDTAELAPPPIVRTYEPLESAVDRKLGAIEPREAVQALAAQLGLRD